MKISRCLAQLKRCAAVISTAFVFAGCLSQGVGSETLTAALPAMSLMQSDHCAFSASQQQQLQAGVQGIRQIYRDVLGYPDAFSVQLNVSTFCTPQSFESHKALLGSKTSATTGFYAISQKEIVLLHRDTETTLQTLFHESSHALLRSQAANYPKWLNEGLAEYFEGAAPEDGPLGVYPQKVKEQRIQRYFQRQHLPALSVYLDMDTHQWNQLQASEPLASSMAWSLVYFLMESPQRQTYVRQLIAAHQTGLSATQAVERVYPGGVKRFEADWQKWLMGNRLSHRWQVGA